MADGKHDAMVLTPERLRLYRSPRGELVVNVDGEEYLNVMIRRAYPLELADRFIGFFRDDGTELGLLERIDSLDSENQQLLREELEAVYFRPVITRIDDIGEEFGVVSAALQTTSGPRQIEIRQLRKNVRLLSGNRVLIEDADGNRYELRDWHQLPKRPRDVLGL